MTEEELARLTRLVVRNVISLEDLAKEIARGSTKETQQIFQMLVQQILDLPEGSVERQMAYEQLEGAMRTVFQPPTTRLSSEIMQRAPQEAIKQIEWAARYVDMVPGAIEPSAMRILALEAVGNIQVLNQAVEDISGPLTRSQWKRVDKAVRTGFLLGESNTQIAARVAKQYNATKAEIRAISRTAVMSLAQESHNAFWDANDDVIVGWRWDAAMDYRVCPVCAPLDGVERKQRSKFKQMPPIHPNCRCHVVPITEAMRIAEADDEGQRSIVELVKDKPAEAPGVRVYKRKVRGKDGKMYWKRVTDVQSEDGKALTMGGFIRRANNKTQEEILGVKRAARFRSLIKGTPGSRAPLTAEEALVAVTK